MVYGGRRLRWDASSIGDTCQHVAPQAARADTRRPELDAQVLPRSFGSCGRFFGSKTSLSPENVVKELRRRSGPANVAANALNLFMWK